MDIHPRNIQQSAVLILSAMSERENIWQSRYYAVPKTYMSLVGLWPYDNIFSRYLSFVPFFTFSFSIIVPQISYLVNGSISLDDIFECVPAITITMNFSYKILSLMTKQKEIKACLKMIKEDWLSLDADVERAILHKHTRYGQYITTFYAVYMMMTAFIFLLKPILMTFLADEEMSNATVSSVSMTSKLPFLVEYGEKLNQYTYLLIIHGCLSVFSHIFITIAVDTLYYTLIQHACGMFTIIGYTLENIGKDSDINFAFEPVKAKDNDYAKALNCLRNHLHVIEFANLIETTYSDVLLISVNLNIITGTLIGIQVIMYSNDTKSIIAPMSVYFAQLIHLFLQFWQAQFLLDYSVVPYESICKSNWYFISRRSQNIFILIMNRTMSLCKITAGKILTLSIETFSNVMRTSMSYFTILRSLQ